MASFNKVMLMGNLTRDIELRHVGGSNTAVANIGLAINRTYYVGEGGNREKRDETTFVDCEAWGRQAEVMSQYLSKGRGVFIEGRLKLDQWQDKEGGNRSKMKVVVENFQFVGGRGDGDAPQSGRGGGNYSRDNANAGAPQGGGGGGGGGDPYGGQDISEDDIPF